MFTSRAIRALIVLLIFYPGMIGYAAPLTNRDISGTQSFSETEIPILPLPGQKKTTVIIKDLKDALDNNRYDRVLREIKTLSGTVQADPHVCAIRAAALIGQGNDAEADKLIADLLTRENPVVGHLALPADIYLRLGKPREAMRLCQKGLIRNARSSRLLFAGGRAWDAIRQNETALVYFEKALLFNTSKNSMDESLLTDAVVTSMLKLQEYEKAGELVMAQTKATTRSLPRNIALAKYHAFRGEYAKAIAILDVTGKNNAGVALCLLKAQILVLSGAPEKAIALLQTARMTYPGSYPESTGKLLASLCRILMRDAQTALSLISEIEAAGREIPNLPLVRATALVALGNKQAARVAMQKSPMPFFELAGIDSIDEHLGPHELAPELALAYFCLDQGYFKQVIEICNEALAKHPNNIFLCLLKGESYDHLGNYFQAHEAYRQARVLMPESNALRYLVARASQEAGLIEETEKEYSAFLKERPDDVSVTLAYGALLEQNGKWETARSVYEMSLNFNPKSLPLLRSLGWTLLHLGDFDALRPVLRTMEKQEQIGAAPLNHLKGWLAYRKGDFPDAVKQLSMALDLWPGDPEICYHLGMAYLAIGDLNKAGNLLDQALFFERQREKYGATVAKALETEIK